MFLNKPTKSVVTEPFSYCQYWHSNKLPQQFYTFYTTPSVFRLPWPLNSFRSTTTLY